MDGNAIGDLDDPTDAQDAATKNYVDDHYYPGTCAFAVTKTQTISPGSWTNIDLDTEEFDLGGDFDASTNHEFVAPATGYYLLSAQVRVYTIADGTKVAFKLVKNDSTDFPANFIGEANCSAAGLKPSCGDATLMSLSQGDTIHLEAYHNHTADKGVICRLSGMRIK